MELTYEERVPPPSLRRYVRCIWSLRGERAGAPETIIPDGCPELLLNSGASSVRESASGQRTVQPRLALVGEVRRPVTVLQGENLDLVGVRLEPCALGVLLDEPADRLVDDTLDVGALLSVGERATLDAALDCEPLAERVRLVEQWLLERVRRSVVDDRLARRAVQRICATDGRASIEDLSAELGVHRRSLERGFKALVGTSPKSFSRVRRFRRP